MSIKSAISFILIFCLILTVLSLSSLAAGIEFPSLSDTESYVGSVEGNNYYAYAVTGSVYYCFITGQNVNGTIFTGPMFVSDSPASVHLRRNTTIQASFNLIQDSSTGLYYIFEYGVIYHGSTPTTDGPVFPTVQEALGSFTASAGAVSSLTYTLPPGNVAYIPIASGQSSSIEYTLTTTYYMAFGNNDTSRINQVVTVMSSLPSSSNNLAPSSPKIPWTNNGNVNLLGVSANKIYQGSIPSNYGGQYLVVVNPMTMPSQTGLIGGDTYTNGSINISVSAVSGSPYIYPMSESLTITPGDGIGSESSYGDSGYTFEVDPETGEIIWTDPNGGNEAPVAGGNNPMPTPNTIFDWLRNISQQLSDFLRGPVQAVQVVVSAIRDFMGSFTQLYQWLPSPVYSLITSALMIALTIGVIKIFV